MGGWALDGNFQAFYLGSVFLNTDLHLGAHQELCHRTQKDSSHLRNFKGFRSSVSGTRVRDQYVPYFIGLLEVNSLLTASDFIFVFIHESCFTLRILSLVSIFFFINSEDIIPLSLVISSETSVLILLPAYLEINIF